MNPLCPEAKTSISAVYMLYLDNLISKEEANRQKEIIIELGRLSDPNDPYSTELSASPFYLQLFTQFIKEKKRLPTGDENISLWLDT